MTQRRGADFRVLLKGTFYAVARINVSADVAAIITSNTEGVPGNPLIAAVRGFSSVLPDLPSGTMEFVSATFDDAQNLWDAPFAITLGQYVPAIVYPAGSGFNYNWPNLCVLHIEHAGTVPGPQPMTIRLQTDGQFFVAAN